MISTYFLHPSGYHFDLKKHARSSVNKLDNFFWPVADPRNYSPAKRRFCLRENKTKQCDGLISGKMVISRLFVRSVVFTDKSLNAFGTYSNENTIFALSFLFGKDKCDRTTGLSSVHRMAFIWDFFICTHFLCRFRVQVFLTS